MVNEVLRQLRSDPLTKDIPVILKTAVHIDKGHRERGLRAGGVAYFAALFDPQALIAAVRAVLADDGTPQPA